MPVVDQIGPRARPGGAGLAAVLAARGGADGRAVTALGDDPPGRELAALLAGAASSVVDLGLRRLDPEKIRVRAAGGPWCGSTAAAPTAPSATPAAAARAAVAWRDALLVADYGRGVAASPDPCALPRAQPIGAARLGPASARCRAGPAARRSSPPTTPRRAAFAPGIGGDGPPGAPARAGRCATAGRCSR